MSLTKLVCPKCNNETEEGELSTVLVSLNGKAEIRLSCWNCGYDWFKTEIKLPEGTIVKEI